MDFDMLTNKSGDSATNGIELKRMEKGKTNKLEVRNGNVCIVGSMSATWQPWIHVEISENHQEAYTTDVSKEIRKTDENTATNVETSLENVENVEGNESSFKSSNTFGVALDTKSDGRTERQKDGMVPDGQGQLYFHRLYKKLTENQLTHMKKEQ
ncbi:hypothetical protein DPMN_157503 [Dreissena polymorpha]|uniref:Uncharacterized protein n=1 Tax=Dreissena polymorpha TaxID=45954 RepID=A0A9D4EI05_DREPO|nr:hypothetical protein DPMN_157503 [Dreissena polymorpha]